MSLVFFVDAETWNEAAQVGDDLVAQIIDPIGNATFEIVEAEPPPGRRA